jgi:hypothetical protein
MAGVRISAHHRVVHILRVPARGSLRSIPRALPGSVAAARRVDAAACHARAGLWAFEVAGAPLAW